MLKPEVALVVIHDLKVTLTLMLEVVLDLAFKDALDLDLVVDQVLAINPVLIIVPTLVVISTLVVDLVLVVVFLVVDMFLVVKPVPKSFQGGHVEPGLSNERGR